MAAGIFEILRHTAGTLNFFFSNFMKKISLLLYTVKHSAISHKNLPHKAERCEKSAGFYEFFNTFGTA